VDPWLFADQGATFGSPADVFVIPDHYVYRMLYSQGVSLDRLGIPRLDGGAVEQDHRRIWQLFADHFYLFRGTPTGAWITYELQTVFGVTERLTSESAQRIYDTIAAALATPAFRPRALFERFNIEVLCTTDAASDPLRAHRAIRASGWEADIRPTFRPDRAVNLLAPDWQAELAALSDASGVTIGSYASFIQALETQRTRFKSLGAVATDHAAESAFTTQLSAIEAEAIFSRALRGKATPEDALRFGAHMLVESARMSLEDGLVMQLHVGAVRNHNRRLYAERGPDRGADIPHACEFTHALRPLLDLFGNDPRLTLIVFTLDESTYSRELAPLAGHYPALKLGPPWWFHDSIQGMIRYRENVIETAGLYNTAGFNDDARSFLSIPARHDLARRVDANWLAGLVVRHIVDIEDAREMIIDCAYRLAKRAYRLENPAHSPSGGGVA
jgi:glucuronate isomerase